MSIARTIAGLPGETRVWVDGHGEATLADCRTEKTPGLDEREATCQMWEDIATRNLCRDPWQPGVSVSDVRAFHASRFSSGTMPHQSS
jgi:hypothetical protein